MIEQSAKKAIELKEVDEIQIKKTLFGGNVTVFQTDYVNLSNLAKKHIAAESKEGELTAENAKLKKENAALSDENNNLREKVRAARSLQNSFSALQRELESWKQRYKKVIEFIENLGLKDKLEQFLHPVTHVRRGR